MFTLKNLKVEKERRVLILRVITKTYKISDFRELKSSWVPPRLRGFSPCLLYHGLDHVRQLSTLRPLHQKISAK
jgi:hypothetical protein